MKETKWNHIKIINLLIENGANVNVANKNGVTPLTISVKSGKADILKNLIAQGADLDLTSFDSIIMLST